MSEVILWELRFFFISLAYGFGLIILYDCLRIFRNVVPHRTLWTALEDFLYWIVCALLTFQLMYKENDGTIRWFAIAGVILAMTFYNYTLSPLIVALLSKLFLAPIRFCSFIAKKVSGRGEKEKKKIEKTKDFS